MCENNTEVSKFLDSQIFNGALQGTFLEIGSFDGFLGNITCFFEVNRKWEGHCIEALPENFELLVAHRLAKCYNLCIADTDDPVWYYGNGRYSGILNSYQWERIPDGGQGQFSEYLSIIPPMRLKKFFELHLSAIDELNLLCVYNTGNQADILRSMIFSKPSPEVLVICNPLGKKSDYLFVLLTKSAYVLIHQIGDYEIYAQQALLALDE